MSEQRTKEGISVPYRVLIVGIVLTALVAVLQYLGAFENLELSTYDARFRARGELSHGGGVVLVTIDPTTVGDLNRKTTAISRAEHAQVLEELIRRGAEQVVYDIEFSSPSDDPNDDYYFQQVLAENPGKVVMARYISQGDWVRPYELFRTADVAVGQWNFREKTDPEGVLQLIWEPSTSATGYMVFLSTEPITDPYAENVIQLEPLPAGQTSVELGGLEPETTYHAMVLGHASSQLLAGEGTINYMEDPDDRIRKMPLFSALPDDPASSPTLSLAAASLRIWPDSQPEPCQSEGDEVCLSGNGEELKMPTVDGNMLINYAGPRGTFPSVSFSKLLPEHMSDGDIPDLSGKIAMVGNTHPTAHDEYPTPFTRSGKSDSSTFGYTSGLEIHANALRTILERDFIKKQDDRAALIAIVVLGLLLTVFWMRVRAFSVPGVIGLVVVLVGLGATSLHLFEAYDFWVITSPLLVLTGLLFIGTLVIQTLGEYREKRFIKDAFSMYLAPAVIEQLIEDPSKLNLGGEERDMTAIFSDVQSFSTISENLSPHELVHLLNEYLTMMCEEVFKHEGTVDKFEGDAIIAFFGAPIYRDDHALMACKAAIHMHQQNQKLNKKLESEGRPQLITRIGINSGPMVVGNMGSDQRMDYTIMGDNVNLAARLEPANKVYGTLMMISEGTYEAAKQGIEARELDQIRVVGKDRPVKVYELLAEKGGLDPKTAMAMADFQAGLVLYRARKWSEAKEKFQSAIDKKGGDRPSEVYIARCEQFEDSPPGPDWDGVFTMKTK